MWDVGSLSGNGSEFCEELRKRMVDVYLFADGEMERMRLLDVGMN